MAGADGVCGTVLLGAGGETQVLTTRVTANSVIFLTHVAFSAGTPGFLAEKKVDRVAGASFKILHDVADGSTVAWLIFN